MLLGAAAVVLLAAGRAGADTASDEARFVQLINQERAKEGLNALDVDGQLTDVARTHSGRMAESGTIFHNPNLAKEVQGNWAALGENVGVGGSVTSLHQAFMNSPGHRANILGKYDRIGVGIVMSDSTIYVTEIFWETRAAPAPAPVRTQPPPPAETQGAAPPPAPKPPPSPRPSPSPSPPPAEPALADTPTVFAEVPAKPAGAAVASAGIPLAVLLGAAVLTLMGAGAGVLFAAGRRRR